MTTSTGHRHGHGRLKNRIDLLVGLVQCKELLIRLIEIPRTYRKKSRSNEPLCLLPGVVCIDQIAGNLLEQKPVKRLVLAKRIDHPIAVSPSLIIRNIHVATRGLCVSGNIQPMPCPMLCKGFALEQLIHNTLNRLPTRYPLAQILGERTDLVDRRWQPSQIKIQTPQQCLGLSISNRPNVGFSMLLCNEPIDGCPSPGVLDRNRWL